MPRAPDEQRAEPRPRAPAAAHATAAARPVGVEPPPGEVLVELLVQRHSPARSSASRGALDATDARSSLLLIAVPAAPPALPPSSSGRLRGAAEPAGGRRPGAKGAPRPAAGLAQAADGGGEYARCRAPAFSAPSTSPLPEDGEDRPGSAAAAAAGSEEGTPERVVHATAASRAVSSAD